MSAHLAEVAESDARDTVAATYAEIRATLGLPVVNLVYRHLATTPGRLEGLWAALVPCLRTPATRRVAGAVAASVPAPAVDAIPVASLRATGIDAPVLRATAATLDAYDRGNAANLIAVSALLHGVDAPVGPPAPEAAPETPGPPVLPPMVAPDRLAPGARALVEEMSEAISGPARPLLVPSLFRHLTQPPPLLALAWVVLRRPVRSPDFDAAVERLVAAARAALPGLAFGVPPVTDAETRAALERFLGAIPRMLLVGAMLRAALAEGLAGGAVAKAGG